MKTAKKLKTRRTPDEFQNGLKFTRWHWVVSVPEWTEKDVQAVREGLLDETLHEIVDGRAGKKSAQDHWEWVMSDSNHPFSFRVCAKAAGCDPDELRSGFVSFVRRLEKSAAQRAGKKGSKPAEQVESSKTKDFKLLNLTSGSEEEVEQRGDENLDFVGGADALEEVDSLGDPMEDIPDEITARAQA